MKVEAPRRAVTMDEVRTHRDAIKRLGERFGVRNIRVFGSVARGEATPDSDLDLLVDVERGHGYFGHVRVRPGRRGRTRRDDSSSHPGWAEAPDPRPRPAGGRRPVRRDDERLADILEAAEKIAVRAAKGRAAFDADEDTRSSWCT